MILAAGLGTRLRPLTDHTPKPLLRVGGMTMLERVARRLIEAGADRLIVNASHLGEQIERFLSENDGFGVEWHLSPEPEPPLDTGGGLLRAKGFLTCQDPFYLHNGDILSDMSLVEMYRAHTSAENVLATVAVSDRPTTRKLLFDEVGLLGRVDTSRDLELRMREARGEVIALGFGGVHVIDPRLLEMITERGTFSILDPYLRLAAGGEVIQPFRIDGCEWLDIGRPEQLKAARERMGDQD
jgi:NDP-sugar pyrophosphorylase family protein